MHDTVELERRGRPTALICTSGFVNEARAALESWGVPELPIVTITHPLSTLGEEEICDRAREAFPQVVAVLTGKRGT